MPNVRIDEPRQEFLQRCIPIVVKEGEPKNRAIAKCNGMYDQYIKRKRQKSRKKRKNYPNKKYRS